MSILEAEKQLQTAIARIYDQREASNIADWVMEFLTGFQRSERRLKKDLALNENQKIKLDEIRTALLQNKPVQYVLGEAFFYGLKLELNNHVLIPRPETEELVDWIVQDSKYKSGLSILDIGTGSGCIPLALKSKLASAEIFATDISGDALELAKRNAFMLGLEVEFFLNDVLDEKAVESLPELDILVSNPPYIPSIERETMHPNVLNHEPHLALFVPDADRLIFYRNILRIASVKLKKAGAVYVEIHEKMGNEMLELFVQHHFEAELRQDFQGRARMIKARKRI